MDFARIEHILVVKLTYRQLTDTGYHDSVDGNRTGGESTFTKESLL